MYKVIKKIISLFKGDKRIILKSKISFNNNTFNIRINIK